MLYRCTFNKLPLPSRHHQLCHAPHIAHEDHCLDCGAIHRPPKSESVQSLDIGWGPREFHYGSTLVGYINEW